jgi:enolase
VLERDSCCVGRFHEEQTINTLNLTLKKGKTVSGCIEMIAKAKSLGWGIVASIESAAETSDDFIAHLAVGAKVGQLKAGGLSNIEHLAKYNALLRISGDRDGDIPYIGNAFRTEG